MLGADWGEGMYRAMRTDEERLQALMRFRAQVTPCPACGLGPVTVSCYGEGPSGTVRAACADCGFVREEGASVVFGA